MTSQPSRVSTISRDLVSQDYIDFGFRLANGRAVGYRVTITKVTNKVDDKGRSYSDFVGTYYVADTHVTMNGTPFGALTRAIYSYDLAEVQAKAAKRMEDARARYERRAA